jgi:hypothetical protein
MNGFWMPPYNMRLAWRYLMFFFSALVYFLPLLRFVSAHTPTFLPGLYSTVLPTPWPELIPLPKNMIV